MKNIWWIVILIVIIIGVGVGWYLVSPLFIEKEVNEAFPFAGIPSQEQFAEMTDEELKNIKEEVMDTAANMPDILKDEAMPNGASPGEVAQEPVLFAQGTFQDADNFHQGRGQARIYQLLNGSFLLRLENFSVTNGPDLRVLLTEHPAPRNQADIKSGAYVELAKLKGNKGNQNYEIPLGTNIGQFKGAVIYCKPFHVVFATATLAQ